MNKQYIDLFVVFFTYVKIIAYKDIIIAILEIKDYFSSKQMKYIIVSKNQELVLATK